MACWRHWLFPPWRASIVCVWFWAGAEREEACHVPSPRAECIEINMNLAFFLKPFQVIARRISGNIHALSYFADR